MAAVDDNILKLIECPVCFEKLKPPVTTCENGHGICGRCKESLTNCGICRQEFSGNMNTLLNQMIESVLIKCKYHPQGCKECFSIEKNIEKHEKDCDFEITACVNCKCTS